MKTRGFTRTGDRPKQAMLPGEVSRRFEPWDFHGDFDGDFDGDLRVIEW